MRKHKTSEVTQQKTIEEDKSAEGLRKPLEFGILN